MRALLGVPVRKSSNSRVTQDDKIWVADFSNAQVLWFNQKLFKGELNGWSIFQCNPHI
jgi:hypothetical protein